jgi:hypothetical protein
MHGVLNVGTSTLGNDFNPFFKIMANAKGNLISQHIFSDEDKKLTVAEFCTKYMMYLLTFWVRPPSNFKFYLLVSPVCLPTRPPARPLITP